MDLALAYLIDKLAFTTLGDVSKGMGRHISIDRLRYAFVLY